jgi:hypothetical protein
LKTAVAMIERRAIPKIGSFIDIVLSYGNQEFRTNFRLSRGIQFLHTTFTKLWLERNALLVSF